MAPGKRCLGFVTALLFPVATAAAEDAGARATARGGVGLADGGDAAGEARNLAAVSLDPRYVLYAGAALGPGDRVTLRGGALDSRTGPVALGAGYARDAETRIPAGADLPGWKVPGTTLTDPTTSQRVHLGLAAPLLDRRMAIALGGHYAWRTSALGGEADAFDLDLSVAGRPLEALTVAAAGRNLLGAAYPGEARTLEIGARYTPGARFGVESDLSVPVQAGVPADRLTVGAGLDAGALDWLAVRAGWCAEAGEHRASVGVGLLSEQAVLDYGLRVSLAEPGRLRHALDLRVLF